jgi:hypothetical protein
MGYDLHIVKTDNWLDASKNPITKAQVDELVKQDKELLWSEKDFISVEDEPGQTIKYFAINWNNNPSFFWYKDQIKCSNAGNDQIIKLIQMSKALGAKLIGDDGEYYQVKKNIFGKPHIITIQPK